jgi:hypothetical protein
MLTFRQFAAKPGTVPATTARDLADLGEARGEQALFTKQAPQRLRVLSPRRFQTQVDLHLVTLYEASLDIFWLRDESLEDSDNLPEPGVIAQEIVEDLEAALAQFKEIAVDLGPEEP